MRGTKVMHYLCLCMYKCLHIAYTHTYTQVINISLGISVNSSLISKTRKHSFIRYKDRPSWGINTSGRSVLILTELPL